MQLTRREIIRSTTAALAMVGICRQQHAWAQSLVPVKLRLNWLLGGAQAPFRLGEERGYFKSAGIDIEILEGRGAGLTAQAVGAHSEMFGLADANAVIAAISKGVPIRAVMAVEGVAQWAIIARADRGIGKARRFERQNCCTNRRRRTFRKFCASSCCPGCQRR